MTEVAQAQAQAQVLLRVPPKSINLTGVELKPVAEWLMLVVEGRKAPEWRPIPESYVKDMVSQSRVSSSSELGIEDMANMARTQWHDPRNSPYVSILAVSRRVTYQGVAEVNGVSVAMTTDRIPDLSPRAWINASRFLTPEEADRTHNGGQTAAKWARSSLKGETLERVVQANGGYFYPCGKDDFIVTTRR